MVFRRLLEHKVRFDLRDLYGDCLLHYCLRYEHFLDLNLIEFLIDHSELIGGNDSPNGNIVNMVTNYYLSPVAFLRRLFKRLMELLSPEEFQS